MIFCSKVPQALANAHNDTWSACDEGNQIVAGRGNEEPICITNRCPHQRNVLAVGPQGCQREIYGELDRSWRARSVDACVGNFNAASIGPRFKAARCIFNTTPFNMLCDIRRLVVLHCLDDT